MEKEKKRMGRPPYVPNERERGQVKMLSAMGVPFTDIARVVGVDIGTLRKYYGAELDTGAIEANAKVAQSLFKQATDAEKPNVVAAIFWLKTRARWRETDPVESKREQADTLARNAQDGTEWADLLH